MEFVNVYDTRSDVTADIQRTHVVLSGASRLNQQVYVADSWGAVGQPFSQALWTINPPSTQTIVDRYIKIRTFFEIEVNEDLKYGLDDALRQYPIHSLCETLTVQINGESISDNVSDKLHALLTYGLSIDDRNCSVSTTPTMPDMFQEYADYAQYGSSKNSLGGYGENGAEDPRGGFVIIPDPVTPLRKFKVVCVEPILMSPFFQGVGDEEEGFVNVNQMNINYRWTQNLSKILSHSSRGNNITAVGVTMYQPPELLVTYLTPAENQMLPALQTLSYSKTIDYIKQQPTLLAGESGLYISDSIKLSQIPKSLYFFVRRSRATSNQNTSDSFCRIDNVQILWNNQSGLLGTATPDQLFEMSQRNGCKLSYQQFSKYRGSVLCVDFGRDIGLMAQEAVGCQGQYTIQLQIKYTNVSSETVTCEAMLLMHLLGTFQIAENLARASLGNLTRDIVLSTKESGRSLSHSDYKKLQGGSFWTGLKSFFNKVSHIVSPIANTLKNVPALAPYATPIAGISDIVKSATGGKMRRGGGVSGGGMPKRRLSRR